MPPINKKTPYEASQLRSSSPSISDTEQPPLAGPGLPSKDYEQPKDYKALFEARSAHSKCKSHR